MLPVEPRAGVGTIDNATAETSIAIKSSDIFRMFFFLLFLVSDKTSSPQRIYTLC
jgi:hypothetical protein